MRSKTSRFPDQSPLCCGMLICPHGRDFGECCPCSQGATAAELRRMFVLLAVGPSARPHSTHETREHQFGDYSCSLMVITRSVWRLLL